MPLEDSGCGEPCILVLQDDDSFIIQIESQVFFSAAFHKAAQVLQVFNLHTINLLYLMIM
jgi:hypothetical protein